MGRSFDPKLVARLREVPLQLALEGLGLYAAVDRDFTPLKDARTLRWIVAVDEGNVELLVTGLKWFDTREGKGGGGAIDLAMHLLQVDFVEAVKRLGAAGL